MTVITKKIKLSTKGDTDIIDITWQVAAVLSKTDLSNGIVTVFVKGSTGGLTTVEYEPGLVQDIKAFFEKIAPKSGLYEHNVRWHDGNGYAHVRASFLGPSISVPFIKNQMELGTWQQIIFIDFDNRPRSRELIVQIMGE
ncbi:MAG: secondary thiamine-phosphate synthase enzyme YjbQ [Candidatus Omnitrophica bacterium]|nr:secondary thiamine-phosphate synthase enzyme YjbQ [Candidatus Omnitrophota bacterium]